MPVGTQHAKTVGKTMSAAVAIISIISFFVGQALVTKRCYVGFLVWALSNLMVAVLKFATGDPSTGWMFVVYFLANAYSLRAWANPSEAAPHPAPSSAKTGSKA